METITDLQCGKAGEYLVCADLILAGHVAFPSEQGLPFDVIAEACGRLIRVQVKTTRTVRRMAGRKGNHHPGYLFHIKRSGKGGKKTYAPGAVDLFALVALDSKEIGYLAPVDAKQTMIFRSPFLEGDYLDERHAERAARIRELRATGATFREIGKEVGVDSSFAYRVCNEKSGKSRSHKYLRECTFSGALQRVRNVGASDG
jgi:hypothetical protein